MRIVKFESPVNKIKNQKFAHIEDFPKNSKIESKFVVLHHNYNTSVLILLQGIIYINQLPPETTHKYYPLVAQRAFKHLFDGMLKFGLINRRDTLNKHINAIEDAFSIRNKQTIAGKITGLSMQIGLELSEAQKEQLDKLCCGGK